MPSIPSRRPSPFSRGGLEPWARVVTLGIASVLTAIGLGTLWLGIDIVRLGGGWYYALTGAGLILGGLLQITNRNWGGGVVFLLVLAGTLVWSMMEIAGKGFMPAWGIDLAGRAGLLTALVGLNILILLLGTRPEARLDWFRPVGLGVFGAGVLAVGGLFAWHWERVQAPSPADPVAAVTGGGHNGAGDWSAFGGSPLGARYTPAAAITPANVGGLTEAWRQQTGDLTPNNRVFFSAQNTPIYAAGRLYACSSSNRVYAMDPATGEIEWRFDPEVPLKAMESLFSVACRAVGYHPGPATPEPGACAARIYVTTVDSRLIALSADTGTPCAGFGTDGEVDLSVGMGLQETGFASSSSGPAVVGNLLVIGQQVSDNQRRDAPSGVVRAYDATSGALLWAWDAERQGRAAEPLAAGEIYPRGTPNVWNVISGDPAAGLVYIGTGNSANDHFGGDRSANEDRFTSAVVAIDMATGETVWDFATMSHDLWDYDLGAQPALMDLEIDGVSRRVVVQGTKQGSLYVLDAATGENLRPVEARPAPQSPALPGERVSPTQPQAVFYPNLSGHPGPDPERIDARHTWGLALVDAALCRRDFLRMDYQGIYTPPSENPHGMLLFPGTIGGMNWGGVGLDLGRGIVVTNHSRLPNVVTMIPRAEVRDRPVGDGGARPDQTVAPQWLAPWGVTRPIWFSALQMPCTAPPWGYLAATDLSTGALLWSQPLGTGTDTGPFGLPTGVKVAIGTANIGGPLVTATGLTFIAAAQDNFLRAYETATGRLLWQGRLPAGGQASPMSYVHEGRQYVVITATGHDRLETELGDYILAFALD